MARRVFVIFEAALEVSPVAGEIKGAGIIAGLDLESAAR